MKFIVMLALSLMSSMAHATDVVCGQEGEDLYIQKTGDVLNIGKLTLECSAAADQEIETLKFLALNYAGGRDLESVCVGTNKNGAEVMVAVVVRKSGFAGGTSNAYVFVDQASKGSKSCEVQYAKAPVDSDFE